MTESDYIFTCPTGNVPIPHGLSLTEYILQDAYKFGSKPALIDGQNGRSYSYYQVTVRVILRENVNFWTNKLARKYQIFSIQPHHKANEQLFIRVPGRGICRTFFVGENVGRFNCREYRRRGGVL